jgi:acetyltransferase-like isoleucine patch superfamily enzyme
MDMKGGTTARRISNRMLHVLARYAPGATTFRPLLHKLRGVKFEGKAFIGDDVYIENEYPQKVVIGDGARITLRTTIIAHMRGPGKVIIGRNVYVGPCSFIGASSGRTVVIGEGSVLAAGSIVTKSVPAYTSLRVYREGRRRA